MQKILIGFLLLTIGALSLIACSSAPPAAPGKFVISAIPDQDPEKLNRNYGKLAAYLTREIGVLVEYKPVTDYTAVVTAFKTGDVQMVWFGGLTGVQARLQAPGAEAILQRDIDAKFTSYFIANKSSGIKPFTDVSGLTALKGHTFTFGSDSSTSGRLMPQYFMKQAGVAVTDLKGEAGFSGSHDKTIKLVEAGTYETGALNSQVWDTRVKNGGVDLTKVDIIFKSPPYYDYHWVIHPDVRKKYGDAFVEKIKDAFTKLSSDIAEQQELMAFFGAKTFIPTKNENYAAIETIGREIGKIQ